MLAADFIGDSVPVGRSASAIAGKAADRSKAILYRIHAGLWGRWDDLAGPDVFLACRTSDYVSGISLPVDGGLPGR